MREVLMRSPDSRKKVCVAIPERRTSPMNVPFISDKNLFGVLSITKASCVWIRITQTADNALIASTPVSVARLWLSPPWVKLLQFDRRDKQVKTSAVTVFHLLERICVSSSLFLAVSMTVPIRLSNTRITKQPITTACFCVKVCLFPVSQYSTLNDSSLLCSTNL